MADELSLVWTYIKAVVWQRWLLIVESILGLLDIAERIFHFWFLPPLWLSVTTGITVLIVAQYLAYRTQVQSRTKLEPIVLEIHPAPGEALRPFVETAHGETHFRMEIYNAGTESGHNVEVRLIEIEPLPRSAYFGARADFPYMVRLAHMADIIVDPSTAHDINPGTGRQFELLYFWESSDHRLMVDGINTKQPFRDARFDIEQNEGWQMTYEISSAQTSIQRPQFLLRREGMKLLMSRLV